MDGIKDTKASGTKPKINWFVAISRQLKKSQILIRTIVVLEVKIFTKCEILRNPNELVEFDLKDTQKNIHEKTGA